MQDATMVAASGERELRCRGCTMLLGLECGNELHVRYKGLEVIARGAVTIVCRRCSAWTYADPSSPRAAV